MSISVVNFEIDTINIPMIEEFLKKIKAKAIKVEEKDPTKMSKEEFFAKIDRARAGKKIKATKQELLEMLK